MSEVNIMVFVWSLYDMFHCKIFLHLATESSERQISNFSLTATKQIMLAALLAVNSAVLLSNILVVPSDRFHSLCDI